MIYALPGALFEANAQWSTPGLVGTITVAVYDGQGNTTIAPQASGIIATTSNVYTATLTAPTVAGQYVVVWNDGAYQAAEDLVVTTTSLVPVTPTPGPGMNVGDLLDQILLDRFEGSHRPRALLALNNRYAQLVAVEDWTWRYALVPCTVSASVQTVTGLPDDFGVPIYLWDQNGAELLYLEAAEFRSNYPPGATPGPPAAWTMIDGQIYLGPTPDTNASFQSYYRRRVIQLSDESQVPDFPIEFQLALVHGARAELLAFYNDPTASMMDAEFQKDIEALRREYLADATGQPNNWPTDGLSCGIGSW